MKNPLWPYTFIPFQQYAYLVGQAVMSPYEFTSKTHSLSTEDLGKFFIDSFIHWFIHLSTPQEPFTLNRKTPVQWSTITRKLGKNKWKIMLLSGAMWSWRGCVQGSGLISKYRNQLKNGQKIRKNTQKLRVIFSVDMILKEVCWWFRVHI